MRIKQAAIVCWSVVCLMAMLGSGKRCVAGGAANGPAGAFFVVVDTSNAPDSVRKQQLRSLREIIRTAAGEDIPLSIWSTQGIQISNPWPLSIPPSPMSLGRTLQVLRNQTGGSALFRPDKAFASISVDLQEHESQVRRPFIVVLTASPNDPHSSVNTEHAAMATIRSVTGSYVYILGIDPTQPNDWSAILAPLGRGRSTVVPTTQTAMLQQEIVGDGPKQ